MPCWTVCTTKTKLSAIIKSPSLMADAARNLGGTVLKNQDGIFEAHIHGTVLRIANTVATVTSPIGVTDLLDQFTQAYGMAAARQSAKEEGWDFTQTGPGTFTAIKATEF